ncbi:hypothetical protein LCGC14_1996500 [marine sediment metagenome]|uniref:Uncharacterized protein n=1 Tax=marine sediment metagenome TaxID=412755 RepID=A0A0F9FSJ6_9ZZZZ
MQDPRTTSEKILGWVAGVVVVLLLLGGLLFYFSLFDTPCEKMSGWDRVACEETKDEDHYQPGRN